MINELSRRKKPNISQTLASEISGKDKTFLSSLLASAPTAIIVTNPDTSIRYVNPPLEKLTGFTAREVIGLEAPHPWWTSETGHQTKEDLVKILHQYKKKVEEVFQRKDGSKIYVEINSRPVKSKGKIKYFIANWVDITERKRSEMALKDSEEFNSSLLYNSPNPIIVINPDTSIKYVNPALEELTGFSIEELAGEKAPYPWWGEANKDKYWEELNTILRQGERKAEKMIRNKNGDQLWIQITSTPIFRNGKFLYNLSNWVDITERKRIEDKLKTYSQQLKDFSEHLEDVRESDKLRISRKLHDELGQSLTFLKMEIAWLNNHLYGNRKLLKEKIDLLLKQVDLTLQNVKRICTELRPRMLDVIGLAAAIEWLTEEFQTSTKVKCKVKIDLRRFGF